MRQLKALMFAMLTCFVLCFVTTNVDAQLKLPDKITYVDSLDLVSPGLKAPVLRSEKSNKDPVIVTVKQSNPGSVIDQIKGVKSWEDILNLETGLYTLLITLGGYFSFLIPGIKSISNNTYRVLIWAVLVIIGISSLGLGSVWQGALSYLFSTSLYEVILKWIIKSPKPVEA